MDVAKKGDRAMILNAYLDKSVIGMVVNVLSDPELHYGILRDGSLLPATMCNEVDIPSPMSLHGNCWVNTPWLLPLRGDPDAQTWTTEQGRKVDAKAT